MKAFVILTSALVLVGMSSCKKDYTRPPGNVPPTRIVQFELYTNEDFSGNTENITFRLHMDDGDRNLFDSSLATMKIQDIPDSLHRIIFRKNVPGNDTSRLKVGFIYNIEHVGISWHLEEFPSADAFKVVKFDFR